MRYYSIGFHHLFSYKLLFHVVLSSIPYIISTYLIYIVFLGIDS
jgi:hypothetical protein